MIDLILSRIKQRISLSIFIDLDPELWKVNEEYQTASEFLQNLFVVNDAAERGVKFMKF